MTSILKTSVLIVCVFLQMNVLQAQQTFKIRGNVNRISGSKTIQMGRLSAPIQEDGSFELAGEVTEPKLEALHLDSSSLSLLWLEPGDYLLSCREEKHQGHTSTQLKIVVKNGPADASVFGRFNETAGKNFLIDASIKGPEAQRKIAEAYADSLFKNYPNAKFLPAVVFSSRSFVGLDATKKYIALLSPELQKDRLIQNIQSDIKRAERLAIGATFDDFALKTTDGKDFKLSSLKGKKIIVLDFWAKWCAPCRAGHPKLVELYKKYADKGLEIVSVSLDNNTEDWLSAIKEDQIGSWINVSDLKAWQTEPVKNNYINYIPFSLMLDGDRKILGVYNFSKPTEKDILDNL